MQLRDYFTHILPKSPLYAAIWRGWIDPINPLTLTFSVTPACQSRCLTCHIGDRFAANPRLVEQNLSLEEIETAFRSLGPIYFFNLSGGEPFMRPDLPEIIHLACIHLKPRLIHIPTNALDPKGIENKTLAILKILERHAPYASLSIKPSVDGVGERHDTIRGVPGNFKALTDTLKRLLGLQEQYHKLHVDLGTVISIHNIDHLDDLEKWVHSQGVESYRHEIAEERFEFHNIGDTITPDADTYARLIHRFKQNIIANIGHKRRLTRITEAVRLVYYDLALRIIRENRQVTPCLGGISNIHLNYNGDLWPCCVLGSDHSMGNLRYFNGDMHRVLNSDTARRTRQFIKEGGCACPLNNQWMNNILLSPRWMVRVALRLLQLTLITTNRKSRCADNSTPSR
ncbi:MAG: radical SAM protein [Magnetococcales bacterium]|nr:radical SAM protein [Magnetococcales bacterium]